MMIYKHKILSYSEEQLEQYIQEQVEGMEATFKLEGMVFDEAAKEKLIRNTRAELHKEINEAKSRLNNPSPE